MYTFDGVNKKIIISNNKPELDILDLYSRWKDWVFLYDNIKFFSPFETDSKNDISGKIIHIFYLINDWEIIFINCKINEVNITNGILFKK